MVRIAVQPEALPTRLLVAVFVENALEKKDTTASTVKLLHSSCCINYYNNKSYNYFAQITNNQKINYYHTCYVLLMLLLAKLWPQFCFWQKIISTIYYWLPH